MRLHRPHSRPRPLITERSAGEQHEERYFDQPQTRRRQVCCTHAARAPRSAQAKAAHNHRSANSEIVYRLERSNELEEELARANRMVDELLAKNQRLQAELAAANAPQVAEA